MKSRIIQSMLFAAALSTGVEAQSHDLFALKPAEEAASAKAAIEVTPERMERPRIDVVFALDTTGSMSGLIEGAKQKIWSIANKLVSGKPTPQIRIGLIGYRDIGDAYVTQRHELSEDIDQVYSQLKTFQADGGGDTPEHVVQALEDAVKRMSWSEGKDVLKVVFLVGDAPPHTDYPDMVSYTSLVKEARQKGIRINTVRCGGDSDTEKYFGEIASLGGGDYLSIAQDGGMVAVTTPHDAELAKLNAELAGTSLSVGDEKARKDGDRKRAAAQSLAAPAAAERASWAIQADSGAAYGDSDLLNKLDKGAELQSLSEEALPENLKGLSLEKKKEAVEEVKKKRGLLEGRIREESAKRQAWIESNEATQPADSFDNNVKDVIRRQAAEVNVTFE